MSKLEQGAAGTGAGAQEAQVTQVEVKPEPIKTTDLLNRTAETGIFVGNSQQVGAGGGSH